MATVINAVATICYDGFGCSVKRKRHDIRWQRLG
jgi:hypothetical protein